jgi:hypothetical protein
MTQLPQDPTNNPARGAPALEEFEELCAEIEAGWQMRDPHVAERLSLAYPHHADRLYAFLSLLVHAAPAARAASPEETVAAIRLRQWLEHEGYAIAHAASAAARHAAETHTTPSPTPALAGAGEGTQRVRGNSLIGLLRRTTRLNPEQLSHALNIPSGFLVLVSRYPTLLPQPVRREITRRATPHLPGRSDDLELFLTRDPVEAKAASRDMPYAERPHSFQDLLTRSGMDAKDQAYWRQLAERIDTTDT